MAARLGRRRELAASNVIVTLIADRNSRPLFMSFHSLGEMTSPSLAVQDLRIRGGTSSPRTEL